MAEEFEFVVDFSDVIEWGQLLPVGWYEIEVTDVRLTKSGGGDPMAVLELTVTGGEYDGRKLFDNMMLQGDGRGRTKAAFRVLIGDDAADQGGRFNKNDLLGAVASVRVTQQVWTEERGGDGELRNRISRYRSLGTTDEFEEFVGGEEGDESDSDEFFG